MGELFCISSAMIKQRLKVRPRINARGEISIIPVSTICFISERDTNSEKTSKMGRVHGFIFCSMEPGKNPNSSSTETIGRVIIIRSTNPCFNSRMALLQANKVLPEPAGPTPKTTETLRFSI
uniref:Uncharacterized protein n=1 Tax=viral metagenome TaxID=1070528 RepID=A0A6C0B8T0_9ZZZZ